MKQNIKEQIWNLLVLKGFKVSSHSNIILRKEIEVKNPDIKSEHLTISHIIKYKFGSNNLQKFTNNFKNYSIPFCHLTIIDGKITKKWFYDKKTNESSKAYSRRHR